MASTDPMPTAGLVKLARDLGIDFDEYTDAGTLKRLVNIKRLTAAPTETQLRVARELQLEGYDQHTTSAELDAMIREARIKRSKAVLATNPQIAEGNYLMYDGVLVEVVSINTTTYRVGLQRVVPTSGGIRYTRYAYELERTARATRAQLQAALHVIQSRRAEPTQPKRGHRSSGP